MPQARSPAAAEPAAQQGQQAEEPKQHEPVDLSAFGTPEELEHYLSPGLRRLNPPQAWPGLIPAAKLLTDAMLGGKKTLVWGDYDADGVTSTALVKTVLAWHGFEIEHFLPHRSEHGYGLNPHSISELANKGVEVILTVDCGISDCEAVARAKELGLTVIISDHHLPPEEHIAELQTVLLQWFAQNQRSLPWRVSYTPYEVWISEVMLQQTQMERGVSYFKSWMRRFPDIASLAAASEEEVLRQWEGLGYYSRARHILTAARKIMAEHDGNFPSDLASIRALPGVGPYTAGAVASIAFGEKLPCVDANVERVVARIFDVDSPVKQDPAAGIIHQWALRLVPEGLAREHNQAMMELGATVCVPNTEPKCGECPVAASCAALLVHMVCIYGRVKG